MRENSWPFLGSEARTAGDAIKRSLRSQHEMIYRNVYLPKGQEVTPVTRAVAAWLWSGRAATVAGLSAAAFHGSGWIDAGLSAELIRAEACGVDGIVIHREKLESDEVCCPRHTDDDSGAHSVRSGPAKHVDQGGYPR